MGRNSPPQPPQAAGIGTLGPSELEGAADERERALG